MPCPLVRLDTGNVCLVWGERICLIGVVVSPHIAEFFCKICFHSVFYIKYRNLRNDIA